MRGSGRAECGRDGAAEDEPCRRGEGAEEGKLDQVLQAVK